MTSRNTENLLDFLRGKKIGDKFDIATSQYASTFQTGYATFDYWSTAQAVRGLIKRGILKGECGWRYYEVELLQEIPEPTPWQVGRTFNIKSDGEIIETECVIWECDRRAFRATCGGFVDIDALEYVDQASLGRIELVGIPEGDIAVELF